MSHQDHHDAYTTPSVVVVVGETHEAYRRETQREPARWGHLPVPEVWFVICGRTFLPHRTLFKPSSPYSHHPFGAQNPCWGAKKISRHSRHPCWVGCVRRRKQQRTKNIYFSEIQPPLNILRNTQLSNTETVN